LLACVVGEWSGELYVRRANAQEATTDVKFAAPFTKGLRGSALVVRQTSFDECAASGGKEEESGCGDTPRPGRGLAALCTPAFSLFA